MVFTPAFTADFLKCCTDFTLTDVAVRGNSAIIAQVARQALQLVPRGSSPFTGTAATTAKAERAIKPESIALGAFGAIVALAALLIAGQLIGRHYRRGVGEAATMRALGADPTMTAAEGLLGALGAIVLGALLAAAVAVALPPWRHSGASPSTGRCSGPVSPSWCSPSVPSPWRSHIVTRHAG